MKLSKKNLQCGQDTNLVKNSEECDVDFLAKQTAKKDLTATQVQTDPSQTSITTDFVAKTSLDDDKVFTSEATHVSSKASPVSTSISDLPSSTTCTSSPTSTTFPTIYRSGQEVVSSI